MQFTGNFNSLLSLQQEDSKEQEVQLSGIDSGTLGNWSLEKELLTPQTTPDEASAQPFSHREQTFLNTTKQNCVNWSIYALVFSLPKLSWNTDTL